MSACTDTIIPKGPQRLRERSGLDETGLEVEGPRYRSDPGGGTAPDCSELERGNELATRATFTSFRRLIGRASAAGSVYQAPDQVALAAAGWWVETFAESLSLHGLPFCVPHVSASHEGELVFEWWMENRKLTVYKTGGTTEYVRVWGDDIDNEMSDGTLQSMADAVRMWRWLQNS